MRNFISKKMKYSREILILTLLNIILRCLKILRNFFVINLDLISFYLKLITFDNDFKTTKYKLN